MKYYAVHKGLNPGIYLSWEECKKQIHKFSGAAYKSFKIREEAENYLQNGSLVEKDHPIITNNIQQCIRVYTDGSCYGNGTEQSFGGYGVYFGDNDTRNRSVALKGRCTNNIAELSAILAVFKILEKNIQSNEHIVIVTDSKYSIRCFTTYGEKCYKKQWRDDVPNIKLIKEGYLICKRYPNIHFRHVYSHTNKKDEDSLGNESVDLLAKEGMLKAISGTDNLGNYKFKIGKYKGHSIKDIAVIDKLYLNWYIKNKPDSRDEVFPVIIETYLDGSL